MRRKLLVSSIILIFLSLTAAFSQEETEEKAVLSEMIQMALSQNPQIKAAEQEWQASLEGIPQAKALPDPVLSYSYFGQSIETRLGPQRNKISLSQKFPFFGKLSLKGEIARSQAWMFESQYRAVKADVELKVKQAFFSLYWLDKSLGISHEEKEVIQRLAGVAQKKYETGQATQQDVLKAQLEISKVMDRILALKQGRKAVVAELNSLLNRPAETHIGAVEEIEVPEFRTELNELYEWAKETRPELRKVQYLIEKNEKGLKLARKNYFPDFQVMVDYIDIGGGTTMSPEDGRNAWMASVGINIPIWRKKLRAGEAEEATKLMASESLHKNIENETLSRVNELFFEVKTAEEQIKLYKFSLLPQAEQSFKASEIGYLTGKVDFLNLLDSERMVLMIKNGYYKAISDLNKSVARLERMIGRNILFKPGAEEERNGSQSSGELGDSLKSNNKIDHADLKNGIRHEGEKNE
ncbi:MAG: TolC family protein [Candidatus Aminicenantes bacterium]|nr:TolC family protein [Candidatus Aminicenantes bacterium]MDH5468879.1 TolC family protein [Candidatus Aminicenantes bacterium]